MYVIGPSLTENSQMARYSNAAKKRVETIHEFVFKTDRDNSFADLRNLREVFCMRGQPCSSINGVGTEPPFVHLVKRDRAVKDHISTNYFHEYRMRLPALDHDHVRMN